MVRSVIGVLMSAATVISLVKSGLQIELTGLPAALIRQYIWLRDMLFEPFVMVLKYFSLTMPSWLKDAIVMYGLIGAAHLRVFAQLASAEGDWPAGLRRLLITIAILLFWPLFHISVFIMMMSHWITGLRQVQTKDGAQWVKETREEAKLSARIDRDDMWLFALAILRHLAIIILITFAFFSWNYLSDVYGPSR